MAIRVEEKSLSFTGPGELSLRVNGGERSVVMSPTDTLLHVLRSRLGLTGAKPGCENGDCGACTVLVDGGPIKSCMMLGVEAAGREVTTVEGLRGSEVPRAFLKHWALQCGYCTSGFLMVAESLRRTHPDATEIQITEWLRSNLCRCTGYEEIRSALSSLVKSGGGKDGG